MNRKTKEVLRRPLPPISSLAELMELIVTRIPCEDMPEGYKPLAGWHTIRVGNAVSGDELEPGSLRIWMRLFDQYMVGRSGTLVWHTVPHLDHDTHEISARFCIDPRRGSE